MINGIPVIASPTDGLKENLDYAGIFAPRKNSEMVMEQITKLMEEPDYYKKWSDLCLKRASEQVPDWDGLENFLLAR
jgi:glycosyltransferase involved in cell wall biosynthesis